MSDPRLEIQMLHDRVMVAPVQGEGERRSSGGIVIPATAQPAKRLVWGEVFGTGQHVRSVAVGDRVLYGQDDHFEVDVSGRTFVVLRERDLHAVASATTEPTRSSSGTGLYL
ncbi:GroES family chaperonin [Actinomycetospora cinnamomea]|nr:co-chaperone GroES [Actinomycetospora cinnamomea]